MTTETAAYPLDLERTAYSYIERTNPSILALVREHITSQNSAPRILDVGCGCGVNAGAIKTETPGAKVVGIEPNHHAAELALKHCDEVFEGDFQTWAKTAPDTPFDGVLLSDVLEHIADPISFLKALSSLKPLRDATWVVSVPNYAVWYNRVRALFGKFDYAWSGLYDRTHLRFFTRKSVQELLRYTGFEILEDRCTPAIVQSAAPLLRKFFAGQVARGDHLALSDSPWFSRYQKFVEPTELKLCEMWPELLGFQIVTVARRAKGSKR